MKKKNKRKNVNPLYLVILCITAMLVISSCKSRPTDMERVRAVFEKQEALICDRIADYIVGNEVEWDDLEGVIRVHPYSNGIIEFRCLTYGIVSASVEAGFYYSPDDEPDGKSVGWLHGELTADRNGYSYSDGTDNYYYTERMCENFYYYRVED